MRKLGWFAFQAPIIGFFIWADWGVSHSDDPRAMPGLATVMGVLIALGLTAMINAIVDETRIARMNKRKRSVMPPPIPAGTDVEPAGIRDVWAPAAFIGDLPEPGQHRHELHTLGRQLRELPKPLRRLR